MDTDRPYLKSHPWITFDLRIQMDRLWFLLGEAYSKCRHLAGTPLQPGLAQHLAGVYMVKGAIATTAIEGNTLSEEEFTELQSTRRRLPPSQQYLQQEVENVLEALGRIDASARAGEPLDFGPSWIKEQNRVVLQGLELEDHVVPGRFTQVRVAAGNYRGAPPQDVEFLMDRLSTWIVGILTPPDPNTDTDEARFSRSFLAAVLAHLYIAWIHPFGDGNGRTARLVECSILAHSGMVPWVASNLLSDHYNRTRSRYYSKLDRASRDRDVVGFIVYSAEGFVDMLREQIRDVQQMQRSVAWINYVHEQLRDDPAGPTAKRRRELVLAMPPGGVVRRAQLRRLTPALAEMYAGKADKTVTRDLNHLVRAGLIRRTASGYQACIDVIDAFLQ
jgi:Fic family protein